MRAHRDGTGIDTDGDESAVNIQDAPSDEADTRAELVDGPAAGRQVGIHVDDAPPALLDVQVDGERHVGYIYLGRRSETDPGAYVYGWDKQEAASAPIT